MPFRTPEASNPNDWLRTRLVAAEFRCGGASMRPKIMLDSSEIRAMAAKDLEF
jgi:hypothetical protein